MTPEAYLPAALARDTVEGFFTEQGPDCPWVCRVLLIGALGALAALPLIRVDVAVNAPGVVRATSDRVELVAPMSGRIACVFAREHESVQAGQALLTFAEVELEERLAHNLACQADRQAAVDDFHRLLRAAEEAPESGAVAEPAFATSVGRREWRQYRAHRQSGMLATRKARGDFERTSLLEQKGLTTRHELDQARYAWERFEADVVLLREQTINRWTGSCAEETAKLAGLQSEARRLLEERERHVVRAPASGALVGFTGHAVGTYVRAGQSLGEVSPDDGLLVDSFVSPDEIGRVAVGQRVVLQIHAFPHTDWGTIEGRVQAISGDAVEAAGAAGFRVIVRPLANHLTLASGIRGELRKGLTVNGRFFVARRSLWQLLRQDVDLWLNPGSTPERVSFRTGNSWFASMNGGHNRRVSEDRWRAALLQGGTGPAIARRSMGSSVNAQGWRHG